MRKSIGYVMLLVMIGFIVSGCATAIPAGALYTEVGFPSGVGSGDMQYSKVGKATSNSYFGLIATGDATITAAAQNGGITKIKYVDYKSRNILGIMGEYTTYVYGD